MVKKFIENIDISVIIVNYNSFDLTKQTIDSLNKYTSGFNYELIIVDNASQDGSGRKLAQEFKDDVVIFNKENIGYGPANNRGLAVAKGEYVLILNNDIIFSENSLGILIDYLKNKNEKILIAPRLLNADGTVQHSVYSFQTLWLSFTTYFFLYKLFPKSKYFNRYYLINRGINEVTEVETVTGAFMLFRKRDLLELGGFDEDYFFYGEDNDLCKRFKENGGKIIYYPHTSIIHLKGGTKKSSWFHEKNHALSVLIMFDKHYSYLKNILARLFFFLGNIIRSLMLFISYLLSRKIIRKNEALLKLRTLPLILGLKK